MTVAVRAPTTPTQPEPASASSVLAGLADVESSGVLSSPTTDRIAAVVAALGDPQSAFPVVHITGTNGKGSTTALTAALLGAHGLQVGAYTSPHLERITERVTVDGTEVPDDELAAAVAVVLRAATLVGVGLTWFEALTAAAMWLFAHRRVDVGVVEVGMLGRWDATNVVDGTVAVVTNVQLDHVDMAGPTRSAIAYEKAGIVRAGATLVLGERDPELRHHFAAEQPGRILTLGRELSWRHRRPGRTGQLVDLVTPWGAHVDVPLAMAGAAQCDNALLALTAAEAFLDAAIPVATVRAVFGAVRVPGRSEIVAVAPTVILDGAHNPAAAAALRLSLAEAYPPGQVRRVLVCGMLAGRDPVAFLDQLGASAYDMVVVTEPDSPRALPTHLLARAARRCGVTVEEVADPVRALRSAVGAAGPAGLVVATGSLHLLGALRQAAAAATSAVAS